MAQGAWMLTRIGGLKICWIAALLLAAGSGCSTAPAQMDAASKEASDRLRQEQLAAIARKYEANGRQAEAAKIQRHIAENFENKAPLEHQQEAKVAAVEEPSTPAREELLARMGVDSRSRKPTAPAPAEQVAELERRNREIAQQLHQEVQDNEARKLTGNVAKAQREITPVSVAAAAPGAEQQLAHANHQNDLGIPTWARDAGPAAAPAEEPPLPRGTGQLLSLCENLPAELRPAVELMESSVPAERVRGLLQLCENRERAQPAAVAVHVLLEDADPIVTIYAAGTLHQVTGDVWDSVQVLSRQLAHRDERVVRLASYLLGEMGPAGMSAVPALEEVRDQRRGLTSLHAAEALTRIAPDDPRSVAALAAALDTGDRDSRWFATVSLGSVQGSCAAHAARALSRALNDKDAAIRKSACLSLGGMAQEAQVARPKLEELAANDNPEVRGAAQFALNCLLSSEGQ